MSAETVVLEFTLERARQEPEEFVADGARGRIGGRRRRGLPLRAPAPGRPRAARAARARGAVPCRCSRACRRRRSGARLHDGRGRRGRAAARPPAGGRRARRPGRPARRNARLPDREPRGRSRRCSCRASGSTPAQALGHRAAISIGTNPHYGGEERRIEPYLLDFEGDLYGRRLVVELWERLRDEQVFESEQALVEQIARDVEATRAGDPSS